MAIETDGTGQIIPKKQRQNAAEGGAAQLVTLLERMKPEIARALPKHVTPERMTRIILTAVRTTPKLALTTPASFLGSVMTLAQLGLEPNTPLGHAYLIPRENRKRKCVDCTLLLGYTGMVELAFRSQRINGLSAEDVLEGDVFKEVRGTSPKIIHEPASDRAGKPLTHVYACCWIKGSDMPIFRVLTRSDVDARRARSAAQDGPWVSDYVAMARKTAIRALFSLMPKSAELAPLAQAVALDDAAESGRAQSWEPEVTRTLARAGVQVEEDDAEDPAGADGAAS